jgi:hypothetical protein
MCLDRHHGVPRVERFLVEVIDDLVEGFEADSAVVTVLEEQKRPLA